MKRNSTIVSCVSVHLGAGLLMVGSATLVHAGKCTVSTIKGTYIYALDGFTIQGNDATQRTPFA